MSRWSRKLNQREDGFTLVELVVAMFVMGLVLVSLIGVQISAMVTISESRMRLEATAFANESIEEMRAIPWNVLAKGMDAQYLTASGGDPRVTAGHLIVDTKDVVLQVAAVSADQDTTKPWPPLFTSTGSNKVVRLDPTGQTVLTARSYVHKIGAGSASTLGLVVIVEWPTRTGTSHTTIWSTAYRGSGCGNLDTQPYQGSCQALMDSSATSGSIIATLTASTVDDGVTPVVELPLLGPTTSNPYYALTMRTAGVAASASSQQVTVVKGIVQYGGTTVNDNDESTQPGVNGWEEGYALHELTASDDVSSPELPPNPADLTINPGASEESDRNLSDSDSPVRLWALSDYRRPATADASSTLSCATGIPVKQPCAKSTIGDFASITGGSGYILMEINGKIIRLSRRLNTTSGQGVNAEDAWAARFSTSAGTVAAVGCTTLTGPGCVSAGAYRTMASLSIGKIVDNPGTWNEGASEGIVVVKGRTSGCTPNGSFVESILVQRGDSQKTTAAVPYRCGQIDYWNGTGYTSVNVDKDSSLSLTTTDVTWSSGTGGVSVEAVAHVTVSPWYTQNIGDAACASDACVNNADAGVISIRASYTISWSDGGTDYSYVLDSTTVINPPNATASFKKAPGA